MLESKFADDFASPFYPLLANMYLIEGDLRRARKVCEIGLDHDSSNVDGKFIFAKVAMTEEKFTTAEKWLTKVVDENPAHFTLEESLIVHKHLKPKKTILTNLHYDLDYDFLLKILPRNVMPADDGLKLNL